MRTLCSCLVLPTLLLLSGCGQKLDREVTRTVQPKGGNTWLPVTPPALAQKLNVKVHSEGPPVDLFVIFANSVQKAQRVLADDPLSNRVVGKMLNDTDPEVDVDVPKGQGYVIAVTNHSDQATTVKITITGR